MRIAVLGIQLIGQTLFATSANVVTLAIPAPLAISARVARVATRNMSTSFSYAAAVSTPDGHVRQPTIVEQSIEDRSSLEENAKPQRPQRPGAGIRSRTSYFRSLGKKPEKEDDVHGESVVREERRSGQHERRSGQHSREGRRSAQHTRVEHQPKIGNEEDSVYVLTLKTTDSLARPMNDMRERYFPKKLNHTPAHLTLFHALPHSQLETMQADLLKLVSDTTPFDVTTGKPFRMRLGVGVNVDDGYKTMKDVHHQLQRQWMSFLSEQDAGGFRPHWTVMNKVNEEKEVEAAFETVRQDLSENMREGRALGLDLWLYDFGRWKWISEYKFGESQPGHSKSKSRGEGFVASKDDFPGLGEQSAGGGPGKRPGMWKRGSSVGDAFRSLSFRGKS